MKIMLDQNTPASTRVRSAEIIAIHAARAIEIEDIEARVSELERATEAKRRMAGDSDYDQQKSHSTFGRS
jgi:hypothetical protein